MNKRWRWALIVIAVAIGGSFLAWFNSSGDPLPLTIDEKSDSIGACANQTRERCSDKGFLSMPIADYLELLDASARMVRPDKTGYTPADVPPIFQRLNLDPDYWKMQIKDFGRLFANVAGKPKDVYEMRSLISKRRFYLKRLKPEPVQTT